MVEHSEDALRAAGLPYVRVVPRGYPGVEGGATRSESVRAGLAALGACDAVVVHDAARPLVPPELFRAALDALAEADAAVAAAPVADTVKRADAGRVVVETLDRAGLWAIQTPQAFRREVLERALDVSDDVLAEATDDAWLVERQGGKVVIVEAPASNFKVTTAHDLAVAERLLLSQREC
jgi:2-C-methyl-D-erythritol 4-phosphate cytidylyltransferase